MAATFEVFRGGFCGPLKGPQPLLSSSTVPIKAGLSNSLLTFLSFGRRGSMTPIDKLCCGTQAVPRCCGQATISPIRTRQAGPSSPTLTWRDYREPGYTGLPRGVWLYNFPGSELGLWLLLQQKFLLTSSLMNYILGTCSLQRFQNY